MPKLPSKKPRATSAKPTTRKAAPRTGAPRTAAPRAPRAAAPRSATPRTAAPRAPRAAAPRAGATRAPRAGAARTSAPRTGAPRTGAARPRAAGARTSAPRTGAPRSAAPRTSAPRKLTPRAASASPKKKIELPAQPTLFSEASEPVPPKRSIDLPTKRSIDLPAKRKSDSPAAAPFTITKRPAGAPPLVRPERPTRPSGTRPQIRLGGGSSSVIRSSAIRAGEPILRKTPMRGARPAGAGRPPMRSGAPMRGGAPMRSGGPTRTGGPRKVLTPTAKRSASPKSKAETTQALDAAGSIRLNKFIAGAGIASRRKADEMITQGLITVNGKVVTELGTKVRPHADLITVNGEPISMRPRFVYLLLNKPKDTIATTSDEKDRTTVMDYVNTSERVYPVGRLDRNTTGVLLLTSDGELTNKLTHPSHEIEREYHVTLDKPLQIADAKKISEGGIDIGEGDVTGTAEVNLDSREPKDVMLILREGKNREVRRLFEALGYEVEKLDRTRFAGLTHRGMSRGETRALTNSEVHALKRLAGIHEE